MWGEFSPRCVLCGPFPCHPPRYWNRRFSERDCQQSPLRHPLGPLAPIEQRKYVVFEPDAAQWNNIRMAAEVVILFAHATGRTLVLPAMQMRELHARSGEHQTVDVSCGASDVMGGCALRHGQVLCGVGPGCGGWLCCGSCGVVWCNGSLATMQMTCSRGAPGRWSQWGCMAWEDACM